MTNRFELDGLREAMRNAAEGLQRDAEDNVRQLKEKYEASKHDIAWKYHGSAFKKLLEETAKIAGYRIVTEYDYFEASRIRGVPQLEFPDEFLRDENGNFDPQHTYWVRTEKPHTDAFGENKTYKGLVFIYRAYPPISYGVDVYAWHSRESGVMQIDPQPLQADTKNFFTKEAEILGRYYADEIAPRAAPSGLAAGPVQ